MARLIQALREYGPKLELGPTASTRDVLEWIVARNRFLRKSVLRMALMEIVEALLHFNNQGIPVKLEGLGTFTPTVDRDGAIRHNYRADVEIKQRSNAAGAYTGRVVNREHIGLDNAGYKALWDAEHPDAPLEI